MRAANHLESIRHLWKEHPELMLDIASAVKFHATWEEQGKAINDLIVDPEVQDEHPSPHSKIRYVTRRAVPLAPDATNTRTGRKERDIPRSFKKPVLTDPEYETPLANELAEPQPEH